MALACQAGGKCHADMERATILAYHAVQPHISKHKINPPIVGDQANIQGVISNQQCAIGTSLTLRVPHLVIFGLALATIGIIVATVGWFRLPSTSSGTPVTQAAMAEIPAIPVSPEEDRFRQDLRTFVRSKVADINQSFAAYQPICPPCRRALFLLCSLCWMRGA